MVESPTYYQAFQPILKRLQTLDIENLSFAQELIHLRPGFAPDFLSDEATFDPSIVYKVWDKDSDEESSDNSSEQNSAEIERIREIRDRILSFRSRATRNVLVSRHDRESAQELTRLKSEYRSLMVKSKIKSTKKKKQRISIEQFIDTPFSENSVFDASQERAVKECLKNRIGIIQGPPGCGKTFIGIQMLRLLLSLSSLDNSKILVLTYKNHALDEFLKGILRY